MGIAMKDRFTNDKNKYRMEAVSGGRGYGSKARAIAGGIRAESIENERLLTSVNIALALMLSVVVTAAIILTFFRVSSVHVVGNTLYTNDEMAAYVEQGVLGDNTFLLMLLYRNRTVEDLPFVESVTVQMMGPREINIVVQEKELAGYVSYKDRNLYIDSEGRVVEASAKKVYGVPAIQGMSFENTQAGEVLKADSAGIFQTVLHALDTMEKYDMSASSLTVTEAGSVSVVFDNVTVILGEDHYYDLKLSKINALLPLLKGRSGIINLTTYTSETKQIILQKNL